MTIKNGKLVILIILVAGVLIVPAFTQNWYQDIYDQCDNFTNVAGFSQGMIANTTPGNSHWGFNESLQELVAEDYTTYIEDDDAGIITVNSSHITLANGDYRFTTNESVIKNHESKGNWSYKWDTYIDTLSVSTRTIRITLFGLNNNSADYRWNVANSGYAVAAQVFTRNNVNKWNPLFERTWGGSSANNLTADNVLDVDRWYYSTITKNATWMEWQIYDDPDRTTLLYRVPLYIAGNDFTYTKVIAVSNLGYATSENTKGWNKNLYLGETTGLTSGIIYTDGFPDTTQPMIVSTQAKIDPGNNIYIQFSEDNITWVNEQNFPGSFREIQTGWAAFNLEKMNWSKVYVRYNFSRSSGSGDVFLRQFRIFWRETPPPGGDNITILAGAFAEYNVSSIETRVGDYVHGNLTSPQFVDGKTYLVDEVTGVPGWDIRFNFTGIPENSTSLAFMAFADYEGNPAHDPQIQAYNFDSEEFIKMVEYGEGAFEWHNASLSLGGFIQNGTGNVWLRFVHPMSGSLGHSISVDYLRLRAFVPTGGTVNVDAWGINWWLMIIWLVLVAIGVFDKNKIILMFAGFFGIILAILMFTTNMMVAVALISINLYLLYEGTA